MKYELPSIELIVIEENNYLKFGEYLNDMQCDDTPNKLSLDDLEYVKKLKQENKQLKDKWIKLKKYIKTEIPEDVFIDTEWFVSILDKMQELQGSDSNEEILNTFLLANIPEIITQEEFNDVKKAIKDLQQENKILKENYERIYNENCILREKHNINDIDLLDENTKLKEVIDKINLIIKGISYGGNEDYYMGKMKEINDLLKEVE